MRGAIGAVIVIIGVVICIAAIVAPAQTATFIVEGIRPFDLTAKYDIRAGTLTLIGTGLDARLVEFIIGIFVIGLGLLVRGRS